MVKRIKHKKYNDTLWLVESYQEGCSCSSNPYTWTYSYDVAKSKDFIQVEQSSVHDGKKEKNIFYLDSKWRVREINQGAFTYQYYLNDDGYPIQSAKYHNRKNLVSYQDIYYERGSILKEERQYEDPTNKTSKKGSRSLYSYEFDRKGNWTELRLTEEEIDASGNVESSVYMFFKRRIYY